MKRGQGFAASPEQREKVSGKSCVVCAHPVSDPAHVVARAAGGCQDPDCVVPLCRACHKDYDLGELDLGPWLTTEWFGRELCHALGHAKTVAALNRRLSNRRDP